MEDYYEALKEEKKEKEMKLKQEEEDLMAVLEPRRSKNR